MRTNRIPAIYAGFSSAERAGDKHGQGEGKGKGDGLRMERAPSVDASRPAMRAQCRGGHCHRAPLHLQSAHARNFPVPFPSRWRIGAPAPPMTPNPNPQTSAPAPARPRWRWRRVVLLVILAGFAALGWNEFTWHRAVRQLREAEFVEGKNPDYPGLGVRLWATARHDWHSLFQARVWKGEPVSWSKLDDKAGQLRNLDTVASALRRVQPGSLVFGDCPALQNVDGLRGLTSLWHLRFGDCPALKNVDGLQGFSALVRVEFGDCPVLQNLDGLKGHASLLKLFFGDCPALKNLDVLKGFPSLMEFEIGGCPALRDLNVFKGLSHLELLALTDCSALQNLDGLKGLPKLGLLVIINSSALQNLDGLKALPKLGRLILERSSELRDIAALKNLTALEQLDLRGCPKIPPEQVAALRAALPNTRIDYP